LQICASYGALDASHLAKFRDRYGHMLSIDIGLFFMPATCGRLGLKRTVGAIF